MFALFGLSASPKSWTRLGFRLAFAFVLLLALVNIGAILMVFWRIAPFEQQQGMPIVLVYGLAIEMTLLVVLIAYRFAALYHRSKESRLQKRMIWLFVLLIAAPVAMANIFSISMLNLGLETWISTQVKTALEESEQVADQYLEEHRQSLSRDMLSMARTFALNIPYSTVTKFELQQFLQHITELRNIDQAIIFEVQASGKSTILARSGFTALLEMEPLRESSFERAQAGEVVLILGGNVDQARGLIKLGRGSNLFLYAGRYLSAQVVQQTAVVKGAVRNFSLLEQQLDEIYFGFLAVFILFSSLCIFVSIFFSMAFAQSVASPISRLTLAAQKLGQGDLSVRLDTEDMPRDETGQLSVAFNSMAASLDMTQKALLSANRDIAQSRDYTQSILRNVSTGIVALNTSGGIHSINERAAKILKIQIDESDTNLVEILPQLKEFLSLNAQTRIGSVWQRHVSLEADSRRSRSVLLKAVELSESDDVRYLLSIDDVTELESAQRLAAWSDVAKRIAHEIRNPLTPIRLATERLRRKFVPLLENLSQADTESKDAQAFEQSTETILRQVDNIALMVKEFSNFARMPKAVFAPEDLCDICREAVFIEQNREHKVSVGMDIPEQGIIWDCDRRQILQMLVNLLKNAAEAILESPEHCHAGEVMLSLRQEEGRIHLKIRDNGPGWPVENKEKLFDSYNTHREIGTGLGLSVVQRIVHEHLGECLLLDNQDGGAEVELVFTITPKE